MKDRAYYNMTSNIYLFAAHLGDALDALESEPAPEGDPRELKAAVERAEGDILTLVGLSWTEMFEELDNGGARSIGKAAQLAFQKKLGIDPADSEAPWPPEDDDEMPLSEYLCPVCGLHSLEPMVIGDDTHHCRECGAMLTWDEIKEYNAPDVELSESTLKEDARNRAAGMPPEDDEDDEDDDEDEDEPWVSGDPLVRAVSHCFDKEDDDAGAAIAELQAELLSHMRKERELEAEVEKYRAERAGLAEDESFELIVDEHGGKTDEERVTDLRAVIRLGKFLVEVAIEDARGEDPQLTLYAGDIFDPDSPIPDTLILSEPISAYREED